MPRVDISFKTGDGVSLKGYFYTPAGHNGKKLPCMVLAHGFAAVKDMDLPTFGETFTSQLACTVLIYDNRGFGESDVAPGQPRQEIIPVQQLSDYQDAITYAQTREEVDPEKIGIWGSSYSAGHVLWVGAFDKRVKAVISQVPFTNGTATMARLIRPDFHAGLEQIFQADRHARAAGQQAGVIPVASPDVTAQAALPTPDAFVFLDAWEKKNVGWKNEVTVRSIEMLKSYNPDLAVEFISPTPLLMVVAKNDTLTPTDLALRTYNRALEPKELLLLNGGHFDAYDGENEQINLKKQVEFLSRTLCA